MHQPSQVPFCQLPTSLLILVDARRTFELFDRVLEDDIMPFEGLSVELPIVHLVFHVSILVVQLFVVVFVGRYLAVQLDSLFSHPLALRF